MLFEHNLNTNTSNTANLMEELPVAGPRLLYIVCACCHKYEFFNLVNCFYLAYVQKIDNQLKS